MYKLTVFFFATLFFIFSAQAQKINTKNTSYQNILLQDTILHSVPFRNVGPSIMSGRVTALSVNPENTIEFYVAYASGGLFYTNNNGQSLQPIFEKEAVITIGDVAVDWKTKTIWIGTGECNSSRSSYAGIGVYKSSNAGKTWQYKGLSQTQHISKIIIDPSNANNIYVASIGSCIKM